MGLIILFLVGLLGVTSAPTPLTVEQIAQAEIIIASLTPQEKAATVAETPNVLEEEVVEEKPAVSEQNSWEKPAKNELKAESTATTPQPTTPKYKYSYVGDFEKAMKGVCPQDVPDGLWPDPLMPSIALGLPGIVGQDLSTPEGGATYLWTWLKSPWSNQNDQKVVSADRMNLGIDTSEFGFFINWPTRSFTWDYLIANGRTKATLDPEVIKVMDATSVRMSNHLKYLDQAFASKCGY